MSSLQLDEDLLRSQLVVLVRVSVRMEDQASLAIRLRNLVIGRLK